MRSFVHRAIQLISLAATVWVVGSANPSVFAAEILPYGTNWRYIIGLSEASSPDPAAWRQLGFDDSAWTAAPAPIGYANPPNSPAEFTIATLVPSSQEGNYSSVFVRTAFVAKNPTPGNVFTVNVNIDDGCIVWINGTEVGRFNVPAGDLAYNQWAVSAGEPAIASFSATNSAQGPVVSGTNILAVQVFNANATSSDLFFDLSLESDLDEVPPAVESADPPAGSTVTDFTEIDVSFTENVTGVDASDLLINGAPATGVSVISPKEYVFSFPAPPLGDVTVSWASNHGITDLASNLFAGVGWNYLLHPADTRGAVIISEFLADNEHGIKDEDGQHSDWIELLNTGTTIANLDGWFLTDETNLLAKWRFPAITLAPNGYLVVFASGKDRTNATAPSHTNFKISKTGGFLALVDSNTNVVSSFNPYPAQQSDISYGRDAVTTSLTGYLGTPTPGAPNGVSGLGFAPTATLSVKGGVYTNNSLSVTMTAPAGQIRYTLDGSVPSTTSTLYAGPITITTSVTLKARAFQAGLLPGPVAAESYIMVDSTVAKFTSNLPLMILSTSGKGVADHPAQGQPGTFASMVEVQPVRGQSTPFAGVDYLGGCEINIRGQTSAGFPKKPYRLSTQDAYRNSLNAGLLGMPPDDDWILNNPYTDKPFLQNFMAYELYEKMGHYSVRRRFVEVFVNTSGGKISYPRDYAGLYILLEKIKVAEDRVNIDKLTPYDTKEPEISGGYMFKKDKDTAGDLNFSTVGGAGFSAQTLKIHQPRPMDITTPQLNWLRNYLVQMEKALYASNWKTATGTNHYSSYLDVDSFVDFHWIIEFAKQIDGYRLSNYFYKPRGGKVHMSPIWDFNLSFGNADYLDGANTPNWYWQELGENDHIWLRRLMCGTTDPGGTTGDPDFNQRITDRWSELRTNVLSSTNVIARAQELAAIINGAANRDFQKWPRLGTYIWPNPPIYSTPTTFAGVIQSFTNWVKGRYTWIDSQFLPVPTFALPEGITKSGTLLTLGGTGAGAIYYMLDGSDPRLPGGSVSSKAVRYSNPVAIQANSKVFARRLNGTAWSGPSVRSFTVQRPALAVTEIMYHPASSPADGTFGESDFEFVEFRNTGGAPMPLQGITVSGGIQFTFTGGTLDPGAYVVIVKNAAAFQSRYGTGPVVAGEFSGQLDNSGDTIVVTGAFGEEIASIKFKDGWYPSTDGAGFSLVPRFETTAGTDLSDAGSWQPSVSEGGSPGAADPPAAIAAGRVVISEILTHPVTGSPQKIELQNLSSSSADISGWFLTDNLQKPRKFRIPAGTIIPADGFIVFTSDQFGSISGNLEPFTLSPAGEEVYLFSADSVGKLTGYCHGFTFGAQKEGLSFGRYVDSTRAEKFVTQQASTFGQTNSGPFAAPVIISEIMYHPPDLVLNNSSWNDTEDEFVELVNRGAQAVPLFDSAYPTNSWRLQGGIQFTFPAGTTIEPNQVILLVNFDPVANQLQTAAFRSKYSVLASVLLFGPYDGSLGNDDDLVSLQMPDSPSITGEVPYVVEDEVTYSDHAPWNSGADGFGFSLARVDLAGFGDDPAKWTAAAPTAGTIVSPGEAPIITLQPKTQVAIAGQNISLSVAATGTGPFNYQWLFKGSPLPQAASATLSLSSLQPTNSGDYSVVVLGPAGATTSDRAFITVIFDSDGDGMPDDWEVAYGLNPFDASDAVQDADGDGFSNRDEYLAGTNPRAGQSYLGLSPSAGASAGVSFCAAPNRSYSVLFSDSLIPPTWKKWIDVPASDKGSSISVADSNSAAQRYYRIVTPAQ